MSARPAATTGAPATGPASPARLRATLIVILVVCGAIAVGGYFYGKWLMKHPPTKEQATPGH